MTSDQFTLASDCGWKLDLRSHVLFSNEDFVDSLAHDSAPYWHSTYAHECSHWVRYHGASIGLLLTALKRARDITAIRTLRSLDSRSYAVVRDRMLSGGPVWSFEPDQDLRGLSDDFGVMGSIWLDLRASYDMIFDLDRLEGIRWPLDEAIRVGVSDAWLYMNDFSDTLPHPGNAVADHIVSGRPQHVAWQGTTLTTRGLWESAGTLDELSGGSSADKQSAQLDQMVLYKLRDPVYGTAWRMANSLCFGGTTVPVFMVAVYIALNPALPFWQDARGLTWSTLYPPARFATLYKFISENMFVHELCDGSPEGYERALKFLGDNSGVARSLPPRHPAGGPGVSMTLVGYLNDLVTSSLTLLAAADDAPSRLIAPTTSSLYAPPATSQLDWESFLAGAFKHQEAYTPRVMSFANGVYTGVGGVAAAKNDAMIAQYVMTAWQSNGLDALLFGNDPADQSYLPGRLRRPQSTRSDYVNSYLDYITGHD